MRYIISLCGLLVLTFIAGGPPALSQAQPIVIGLVLPLSGQVGDYTKRFLAAPTEFAAREVNEKGGIMGRQIKVVSEDSHFDSATAVSALNKLADVDHVKAVFTAFTPLALPQLPVAEEKKILLLAPSTEHPDLTKSRWAVRMTPTADKAGIVIADVAKKLSLKSAAVLAEDNESIRITARAFSEAYEKGGGKIVGDESFKAQDTDMRAQLTKIRAAQPEALYIIVTNGRGIALALKQIGEANLRVKQIFANHLIEDREVQAAGGGAVAEGTIYTSLDLDPAFAARWKTAMGYDADANVGKTYDATMMLFEAMRRARTADDPAKIRDAIYSYGTYKGVVGTFQFSGSGEPRVFPVLKIVKNGQYVKYGR